MVFKYIKDEKLDSDIKGFPTLKDGYFTLEFNDHQKALNYYNKANFRDVILIRPFNIYFDLKLE